MIVSRSGLFACVCVCDTAVVVSKFGTFQSPTCPFVTEWGLLVFVV